MAHYGKAITDQRKQSPKARQFKKKIKERTRRMSDSYYPASLTRS
jgi:hypothetical protein